ncbi:MAG: hypothetical protein LBP52_08530, partial [Burkholderiaceae bacterium]|nr:hypothetical protein [Burkholderiaceae bacterium]
MEQQVELTRESAALAWGTPQVVAYRVARMALVDPVPSGRDQREFMRMGSEKLEAFQAAWITAFSRGMAWQQVVAMDWANLGWQLGCGAGWLSPRAMQEMALDNVMTAFTSTL